MESRFLLLFILLFSDGAFALTSTQTRTYCVEKINLNTANAETIAHSFKGIGQKRAEAIVHYREAHGRLQSIMDLARVRGLGLVFVRRHLSRLEQVFFVDD